MYFSPAVLVLVCGALSSALPARPLGGSVLAHQAASFQAARIPLEQAEAGAWWRGRMQVQQLQPGFLQLRKAPRSTGRIEPTPLELQQKLLICTVTLGDGRSFKALVDTGSGNLAVPSADCRSQGCSGRRGFEPDDDDTGSFVPGAADLHLSFATGKMEGTGFKGKVCFGHTCGQAGFLVAASESKEFQHFRFDGILGLGPPRQALAPGFNIIGSLAQQHVLPTPAFTLSLRSSGNSSLALGTLGAFDSNSGTANTTLPPWLHADAKHGEWAVDLQDIKVDGRASQACGKEGCRAVLDSGCGGIALPAPVLKKLEKRLKLDGCSERAIQELPTLGFVLGNGRTYDLHPKDYVQIVTAPISEELTDEDDDRPHCHLLIQRMGGYSTRTAILGLPFLFDRDTTFDQERMRVGLVDVPIRAVAARGVQDEGS